MLRSAVMRRALALSLAALAPACTRDTSPLAVVPTTPAASETRAGAGQTGTVGERLGDSLVVRVTDRFGNPVAGVPVSWAVASGGGTVSPTATVTDDRGEARTAWTLGTVAGANAAVATIEGLGTIRFEATGLAGPPAQLIKVSGDGQTATVGTTLPEPLVVKVADRFGNAVSGATVTWAAAGSGGVNPTSSISSASGEATTRWALGTAAGQQTVTASLAGVAAAQAVFTATGRAGPPANVVKVAGDNQTGTVATALTDSLAVRVTDQYGNPVSGVTVTWTVTSGGGSVSPTTSVTGSDGLARTRWTLGTIAGANTVQATVAGLAPASFLATGRAGPPATITKLRGDAQSGNTGSALADSLVVRVTDSFGNPVSGAIVTWTVTAGGGSVSPASSATNATGEARTRWTLGAAAGQQSVSATVGSLPPLVFTATANVATGPNLTIGGVTLTQATQTLSMSVPILSMRTAFLRVFVTADRTNTEAPTVRVRFYSGATVVATQTIPPPTGSVPLTVDEAQLTRSWNLVVAGTLLQAGVSMLVDVDPDGAVSEPNEGDNAYPSSGQPLVLDVRTPPPYSPLFVPVRQTANGLTGNVNETNLQSYLVFGRKVLPITTFNPAVRAVYTTSAPVLQANDANGSWETILTELNALRVAEGSTRPYYGVVRVTYTNGVAGLGYIGHPVSMGWDGSDFDEVAAHEWGHTFNRLHAPGCGAADPEPGYPYAGGRIGVYGVDPTASTLYSPQAYFDLMSYCFPVWISDFNYRAILGYRAANPQNFVSARSEPSLLIWGRTGPRGLELEPAFEVTTRPVLPDGPGAYTLTGLDQTGGTVFSLSFDPVEVGDGTGAHFAFAVPISQVSLDRLARIQLSGPGQAPAEVGAASAITPPVPVPALQARRVTAEDVEILWDMGASAVIMVRDPATGTILSFARGGVATIATDATTLELVLSDGVRSSVRQIVVR
jgi:hypothetical protein